MSKDEEDEIRDNLDNVAYEVAMSYIAKSYTDLRKAGLSRMDAAAIVAAIIARSSENGED